MSTFAKLSAVALLASVFAAPAYAQDQQKPDKIVLESKVGSVMTSTGGDYQSANTGNMLVRDESMMLSDGANATVVYYYDNGKRQCTKRYSGPNTYVIDDNCVAAAYMTGNNRAAVGILVGAALVGAAIIGNNDSVVNCPTPVSGGAR